MDKPDVFMPLYIGDYLAGTSRLTTELHGAYLLLIMDYWMNGPLPDDDALLASIAKMTPDAWSNARATLEKYFSISEGCWKQKRIEEELAAATEKKRKAREKAKKAASARWDDAPSNASSNASAKLEECPSPSPSPSESTNKKDNVASKDATSDYSPEFESAWKAYPKRHTASNKKETYKQWKARIRAGFTAEKMTEGVTRYYEYCKAEGQIGTKYVKLPATFFGPDEHFMMDYHVKKSASVPDPTKDNIGSARAAELIKNMRSYQ